MSSCKRPYSFQRLLYLIRVTNFDNAPFVVDGGDAFVVLGDLLGRHRATPDDHTDGLVLLLRQRHLETEILGKFTNFAFLQGFFPLIKL